MPQLLEQILAENFTNFQVEGCRFRIKIIVFVHFYADSMASSDLKRRLAIAIMNYAVIRPGKFLEPALPAIIADLAS